MILGVVDKCHKLKITVFLHKNILGRQVDHQRNPWEHLTYAAVQGSALCNGACKTASPSHRSRLGGSCGFRAFENDQHLSRKVHTAEACQ